MVLMQHLVSSFPVSGRPVHRLRENSFVDSLRTGANAPARKLSANLLSLNLCSGRPLTESDDTRYCINTIQPPDDEHIMLETCRGLQ